MKNLKILIKDGLSANQAIRRGIGNSFGLLGCQVYIWDNSGKSAFDAFAEFEPDIFIGDTYTLKRDIVKNIVARPHLKTLLYAPNWGDSDESVPKEYPILFAQDEEKKWVEELVKAGSLEWIFGQYPSDELSHTHNKWEDLGVKVFSCMPALDTVDFYLVPPSPEYACDIFFCGGYWPYKSTSLQTYLLSLCYPNTKLNIKIFGNGWSVPQALGPLPTEQMPLFYSSSKVCLNLFEPHSTDKRVNFSDYNSRLFQGAGCGGFMLTQKANRIEDIFGKGTFATFENIEEYKEKLTFFLSETDESKQARREYVSRGMLAIYKNHTYLHRIAEMLDRLGFVGLDSEFSKTKSIALTNLENIKGALI